MRAATAYAPPVDSVEPQEAAYVPSRRTTGEGFAIPTFEVVPSDVAGFMDELWEFQSTFHDCFPRSEPRVHFFDYMVGQLSALERKSIRVVPQ